MAKIAIVDDNALCARALSLLLVQMGHDAACISSGTGVLDNIRQARPDLLVLDVEMPGMDGLEILRQLRQDPRLRNLSVLMFSGECDGDTQAEAYQLGAVDYIIKGRDWKTLRARITQHLPGPSRAEPAASAPTPGTRGLRGADIMPAWQPPERTFW